LTASRLGGGSRALQRRAAVIAPLAALALDSGGAAPDNDALIPS